MGLFGFRLSVSVLLALGLSVALSRGAGEEGALLQLPELLAPVAHPERLEEIVPWQDGGALLELFEKRQAQLSDADRVRLLLAAAQAYGKPSAYASCLRSGLYLF